MEQWISIPKVELHAHLNGSIRESTLLEIARTLGEKGTIVFSEVEHVIQKDGRSLKDVFKLFDLIHILTTDHSTLTRITKEVIEDFASENAIYLELRTTPKKNHSIGMTKRSYMDAVIKGLREVSTVDVDFGCQEVESEASTNSLSIDDKIQRKKIYVRLLLSIDRRDSTASAMETVELALEMRKLGVIGIDLSGNPVVGEWATFLPVLEFARQQGLCVTLHCGEVPNPKEVHAMLDFHPGRIGHACFFDKDHWERLKTSKIPVEICLTSNIVTESVSSIDVHHFAELYKEKHPMVLCTDDSGVFSTSLSKEYHYAASSFGLGKKELLRLAKNSVEFIFAGEEIKSELRQIFRFHYGAISIILSMINGTDSNELYKLIYYG